MGTDLDLYGYALYVEAYDEITRYPSREFLVLGQSMETYKSSTVVANRLNRATAGCRMLLVAPRIPPELLARRQNCLAHRFCGSRPRNRAISPATH